MWPLHQRLCAVGLFIELASEWMASMNSLSICTTFTNSPHSDLDNFLFLLQLSRKRKMCKERTNCIWRSQWLQLVPQKRWMKFPTSNAPIQASLISDHLDYSIVWFREQLFISPADSTAKLITEKDLLNIHPIYAVPTLLHHLYTFGYIFDTQKVCLYVLFTTVFVTEYYS